MLVKMDQQEQEEQEQEEQDLDHTETLGTRSTPSRSIMRNPSPMKPLQEVCGLEFSFVISQIRKQFFFFC